MDDSKDAWFWTPEWQKAECEAQRDIESGNTAEFDSVDDLIDDLNEE